MKSVGDRTGIALPAARRIVENPGDAVTFAGIAFRRAGNADRSAEAAQFALAT